MVQLLLFKNSFRIQDMIWPIIAIIFMWIGIDKLMTGGGILSFFVFVLFASFAWWLKDYADITSSH